MQPPYKQLETRARDLDALCNNNNNNDNNFIDCATKRNILGIIIRIIETRACVRVNAVKQQRMHRVSINLSYC